MSALCVDTDLNDVLPTILRNPDGSIEYPSRIPPAVDFPVTSPNGTPQAPLKTASAPLDTKVQTLPPITEKAAPSEVPRPKLDRQWMTERLKPATRRSALPQFRRHGTNISALNEALWNPLRHHDDTMSSSSSSSSSEDEEEPQQVEGKKHRRGRKGRTSSGDIPGQSGERYSRFAIRNEDFRTKRKVDKKDG